MKYMAAGALIAVLSFTAGLHAGDVVHPAELTKADIAGAIFERDDVYVHTYEDGHSIEDVTSFMSSDGRLGTGMYSSEATRSEINEPYGVDEFMFFLEGSVTLTSSDGTVQTIEAGEGVTIPKEWTGIWETDGYKKIWVIYSEDGSGLE